MSDALQAFNEKMFAVLTTALSTDLSMDDLVELHDDLVDQWEETEGSDHEAPVSFALTAVGEAIRLKQVTRMMN